jgi:hypothetical protein
MHPFELDQVHVIRTKPCCVENYRRASQRVDFGDRLTVERQKEITL